MDIDFARIFYTYNSTVFKTAGSTGVKRVCWGKMGSADSWKTAYLETINLTFTMPRRVVRIVRTRPA